MPQTKLLSRAEACKLAELTLTLTLGPTNVLELETKTFCTPSMYPLYTLCIPSISPLYTH
jgi:hypothetical protein